MTTPIGVQPGKESRYYTDLGRGSDHILRCADCKALSLITDIKRLGCCPCGNKRFKEVTMLNEAERATVAAMDFPHRDVFLAEFRAV